MDAVLLYRCVTWGLMVTNEDKGAHAPVRPGIRDVARAAGTGVSTVSRALNGHPDVSEAKRRQILAIADELGYRQHAFARGLIRGRTSLVAVVANEFHPFNGAYYTELLQGLAAAARERGLELLLNFPTPFDGVLDACTSLHRRGIADGAIVVSPSASDEAGLRALIEADFAIVVANPLTPLPWLSSIGLANTEGARAATRHLLDLGHRRIGLLDYLVAYSAGRDRRAGYEVALHEAGLVLDPALIAAEEPIATALGRWLADDEPPTALLCFNDATAYAAIGELAARGLAVPRDLSVVGFGDLPSLAHFGPGLTTVRQPVADLGRRAMTLLAESIAARALPGRHEQLATALIARGSSGPPPRRS